MPKPPPDTFKPRRLDRFDLAHPMPASLRSLPPTDAARFHGERQDQARRLDPLGPRARRRAARYAVAGAISFPLLNLALGLVVGNSLGSHALWLQAILGALYGALLALLRPGRTVAGLGLLATGLLGGLLTGANMATFRGLMDALLWFCVGLAVGIDQEMSREEGIS